MGSLAVLVGAAAGSRLSLVLTCWRGDDAGDNCRANDDDADAGARWLPGLGGGEFGREFIGYEKLMEFLLAGLSTGLSTSGTDPRLGTCLVGDRVICRSTLTPRV